MDTREILELAAKACGALWHFNEPNCPAGWRLNDEEWNPLHDSGQCADMEAALSIDIDWRDEIGYVRANWYKFGLLGSWVTPYAEHSGDKQAARRMASTRAAAEIGRRMGK